MKKNNIYIKLLLVIGLMLSVSCESLDLDKTEDPFNLTPDKADVEFLFNAIQENFVRQLEGDADYSSDDNWQSGGSTTGDGLSLFGAELTRMYSMSNTNSNNYASVYQASDGDDEWLNAYSGILANIRAMTPLAEATGKIKQIGISQFIEAYTMTAMVDFFGDVPYSETGLGLTNLNPKPDSGASIYAAAIELLDKAIVNFEAPSAELLNPNVELFYDNDYTKWIKAANTLKMKLYLQTRSVDPNAITKFNAIVTSGDYISTSDDDLVYQWGATNSSNPDNRHPRFGLNYTKTGALDYTSNWFMGTMNTLGDPRIRYYFYRQTDAVPGQEIAPNEETLKCSLQSAPAHYIAGGFTFCSLPNGYWGRDHGDKEGLPPDNFKRSTFGVYPAGGKFDGDNFENVGPDEGAKGKGITPILLSSWVNFMKAEVALVQNNPSLAKTEMMTGMTASIDKVMSFGNNDPAFDSDYQPTPTEIENFMDFIGDSWDSADDIGKWNIFGVQYFISVFGNGIESYNFYRRTGYPTSLQPNRAANAGGFVRSLYYPSNSVNTNSNISQKATQTVPVFWNTNNTPLAN